MAAKAEILTAARIDDTLFHRGLASMKKGVQGFSTGALKQVAGAIGAAFAVRAVINFSKETLTAANALDNMSKSIGVDVENLQALQRISERAGVSAERLDTALHKIAKSQAATATNTKMAEAFATLGISAQELATLKPDEMFERISRAMRNVAPNTLEAAAAMQILGSAGLSSTQLNDVMNTVARDGLTNIKNQLLENNEIMSKDSVLAADQMEQAYTRMTDKMLTTGRNFFVKMTGGLFAFASAVKYTWRDLVAGGSDGPKAWREGWDKASADLFGDMSVAGKPDKKTGGTVRPAPAADEIAQRAAKGITVGAPQAADSLAKIGGIIGGQTDPARMLAERNIKIQEKIKELTEKALEALNKVEKHTAPIEEE